MEQSPYRWKASPAKALCEVSGVLSYENVAVATSEGLRIGNELLPWAGVIEPAGDVLWKQQGFTVALSDGRKASAVLLPEVAPTTEHTRPPVWLEGEGTTLRQWLSAGLPLELVQRKQVSVHQTEGLIHVTYNCPEMAVAGTRTSKLLTDLLDNQWCPTCAMPTGCLETGEYSVDNVLKTLTGWFQEVQGLLIKTPVEAAACALKLADKIKEPYSQTSLFDTIQTKFVFWLRQWASFRMRTLDVGSFVSEASSLYGVPLDYGSPYLVVGSDNKLPDYVKVQGLRYGTFKSADKQTVCVVPAATARRLQHEDSFTIVPLAFGVTVTNLCAALQSKNMSSTKSIIDALNWYKDNTGEGCSTLEPLWEGAGYKTNWDEDSMWRVCSAQFTSPQLTQDVANVERNIKLAWVAAFLPAAIVAAAGAVLHPWLGVAAAIAATLAGAAVAVGGTYQAKRAHSGVVDQSALAVENTQKAVYLVRGVGERTGQQHPVTTITTDREVNAFATISRRGPLMAITLGMVKTHNALEIESVVAHEFGHIKNNDVRSRLAISGMFLGANSKSSLRPLYVVAKAVVSWVSRCQETRADMFAVSHGYGPGLVSWATRTLALPQHLQAQTTLWAATHPVLNKRLAAYTKWRDQAENVSRDS